MTTSKRQLNRAHLPLQSIFIVFFSHFISNRIEIKNQSQLLYRLIIPIVQSNADFDFRIYLKIEKSEHYAKSIKELHLTDVSSPERYVNFINQYFSLFEISF